MDKYEQILDDCKSRMQSSLNNFNDSLKKIRTGRANPSMLDNIFVEAYGSKTPINQLGNISVQDASTITIQIWDISLIKSDGSAEYTHILDSYFEIEVSLHKKLTNIRASGTDEAVKLTTPTRMNLEQAISYINNDELVEVTPSNIRLRKIFLDPHERKRNQKIAS